MEKIERLVITFLIAAFVLVSIPKVMQRRDELIAQQTAPNTGSVAEQPADTARPQFPPSLVQPVVPDPVVEVPGIDGLPVAAPAVNPNAAVFARWAIVVSMFVVTAMAAIGVGVLAFFLLRPMRREAGRAAERRNQALGEHARAYHHWKREMDYRDAVLRRASRPVDEEEPRRRRSS